MLGNDHTAHVHQLLLLSCCCFISLTCICAQGYATRSSDNNCQEKGQGQCDSDSCPQSALAAFQYESDKCLQKQSQEQRTSDSCLQPVYLEFSESQQVILALNKRLDAFEASIDEMTRLLNQQFLQLKENHKQNLAAQKFSQVLLAGEAERVCGPRRLLCGDALQCVSHLAVCDGYKECYNGADEDKELCRTPFFPIRLLRGVMVRKHCADVPTKADALLYLWSMQKIQPNPTMPSRPMVLWKYVARFREKDGTQIDVSSVEVMGTYNFATRTTQWQFTKGQIRQPVGSCTENVGGSLECHVSLNLDAEMNRPCVYAVYQTIAYKSSIKSV